VSSDRTTSDPIAIVGIGCRYADARGPSEFWEIVRSGRNTVRDVPQHRIDLGYDIDHFYDPRLRIPGKISSKKGGFLEHPELFDPAAFGIAPRDALTMEPQQRLMVEVTWDALEDAGIVPESLMGERVAVMLGYMAEDYSRERTGVVGEAAVFRGYDVFSVSGMSHAVLSGRIAYMLGVTGPSFTVDTACSSSLITTHLACQSLRRGESKMAIAGGVNLFLSPEGNIALSRSGMLSMSGACKAFDASADGFVRAEGAGVVVLRPLADALEEGNPIYAVIRGSGISSDGRDGGHMMAPGRGGQAQAMRDAYAEAGISPSEIQYVEAHGTGTMIGDPVEIAALADVMGPGRSPDRPLRVASVKGNLGHTESASGVAGLIKTVLSIKHREIPAQLHFETPNPAIPWDEIPIRVQSETTPWPGSGRALAGVNSFGISGTNAHVVLEGPPEPAAPETPDTGSRRPALVPISGHNAKALHEMVENQFEMLGRSSLPQLEDLAYTLSQRRSHRAHRLCVVARSTDEMRRELEAYLADSPSASVQSGIASPAGAPKIVMIFPGQGSQWLGMGRGLLENEDSFADSIDRIDAAYRQHVDWSLRAVLDGSSPVDWTSRLDVLQPVLVAVEIALAELWGSWGIRPDRVIGQSMGEIAAAYVAGILRLEDVAQLACHRGRIVDKASGRGAMAVVSLSVKQVTPLLEAQAGRVEVAGSNSPTTTILSGDRDAVMAVVSDLDALGVFARRLEVDFASHCFHMDPLLEPFRTGIEGIKPASARIPFDSTVDEGEKSGDDLDVDYWARNLRESVAFEQGLSRSIEAGGEIFIEVSPHPTLSRATGEIAQKLDRSIVHVSSLQRDQDEQHSLMTSLGELFVRGAEVDFERLQPRGRVVETPLYAYQRKRFWFSERNRSHTFRPVHPLLGTRSESSIDPRLHAWDFVLDTDSAGFIQDYAVNGRAGAPAALYPELALAVSEAMWPGNPATVHHLELIRPLVFGGHGRCWVQVNLCVEGERSGELRISSRENEQAAWTLHATCQLAPANAEPDSPMLRARVKTKLDRANNVSLSSDLHFSALERCGVALGASCRTLRELESEPAKVGASSGLVARMMLPRVSESEWYSYRAHPAILEGCLQLVGTLLEPAAAVRVMALGEITFNGELGSDCWCRVSRRESGPLGDRAPEVVVADLEFFDRQGLPIGWIEGVQVEALPEQARQRTGVSKGLHRIDWVAAGPVSSETKREVNRWIIVSDSAAEAASLTVELEKQGDHCFFCEKIEDLEPLVDRLHADALAPWGLVLLAWSESGFDGPSGALAHRAFRIASWAAAIRDHRRDASQVWLATRGVQSVRMGEGRPIEAGTLVAREIDTFARCAEMLQCRHFDASARLEYAERVCLAGLMGRGDLDRQFVARGEDVFVPRLATIDLTAAEESGIRKRSLVPAEDRNFRAVHTGAEGLECLALAEIEEPELVAGNLLIEVRSAALSQLDVLTGLGLARRSEHGHDEVMQKVARDFSGIVRAVPDSTSAFEVGDEVIGIHAGAFSRRLVVPSDFVVRKPSFFDDHEAASVPFPFLVAKYALQVVARLRAGERVLILSAAGGIGQALIQVARSVGAEVNATASSPERCAVLRQLGARVLDFGLEAAPSDGAPAEGLGDFDVIVSANSGSTMHAMLARLAAEGRYIDLCPRARFERPELGALRLGANRSVSAIDIGEMIQTEPTLVSALLEQIAEDANRGRLQPIEATVFNASEGARALRFMAQNRHIGRVCVDLADARETLVRPDVKPGTELAGRGVFVVGGLGGGAAAGVAVDVDGRTESDGNELEIGPAVASWLRDHGVDEVIELGSRESDGVVATIREQGLRLGGWVQIVSERDRRPDEIPPFWTAGPVDFCALVSVRESAGDDRDRNRAWETRLTVDRLLLSNTRDADRSIGISVGRDVAPERVIQVLEKAIVDDLSEAQVVVLSDDDLSARLAETPSPILAELRQGSESRQRSHLLRAELLSLTPPERRTTMQQFVCETLAGVLGLSEEQRLALDVGSQLDAVGLDSLMTMELFMGLGRDLDLDIAADWFDSVPSLAAIAAVLVERLEEAASPAEDS
jgi:acyl transferase domain-containing protein/D-arabinose 1-dehydrogenase-like Zn-dependent alcohol dehydrogenase/acyl carrier protein